MITLWLQGSYGILPANTLGIIKKGSWNRHENKPLQGCSNLLGKP
jgi:hypothetical protein